MAEREQTIPSLADRVRPLQTGATIVAVHCFGRVPVFVLGEESLLFAADDGERKVNAHAGGILASASDGKRIVTGGDDGLVVGAVPLQEIVRTQRAPHGLLAVAAGVHLHGEFGEAARPLAWRASLDRGGEDAPLAQIDVVHGALAFPEDAVLRHSPSKSGKALCSIPRVGAFGRRPLALRLPSHLLDSGAGMRPGAPRHALLS